MDDSSRLVERMAGSPPRDFSVHTAIWTFCLSTMPAYFSLLAFGYSSRVEVPILVGGAVITALCWVVNWDEHRRWQKRYAEWQDKLN